MFSHVPFFRTLVEEMYHQNKLEEDMGPRKQGVRPPPARDKEKTWKDAEGRSEHHHRAAGLESDEAVAKYLRLKSMQKGERRACPVSPVARV